MRRLSRALRMVLARALRVLTAIAFFFSLSAPYAARAQDGQDAPVEVELAPAASDAPAASREVEPEPAIEDEEKAPQPSETEPVAAEEATRPRTQQGLPDGTSRSAVTPQAISLPKAEGSIEGMGESFTPNLSAGTGTFSVPIALPPGRAGVQPSLALAYSTGGGNGPVGVGWSLAAPFIARQTDRGLPRYVDSSAWQLEEDRFIYNGGQELVPVDSAEAAAIDGGAIPTDLAGWQQYRARVEGAFMRFFRAPDGLSWVVQDKNGTRFDFGLLGKGQGPDDAVSSSVSALVSEHDGGQGRVFQWNLTRMSDAHGSTVYYRYRRDGGQSYLEDLYYVSPLGCVADSPVLQRDCAEPLSGYARRVRLVYESREDVFTSYASTWRITSPLRLRRIEVTGFDADANQRTLVRRYHLRYDPQSFISLLTEVQVEGRPELAVSPMLGPLGDRGISEPSLGEGIVGKLLPPMRFTYSTNENVDSSLVPGHACPDSRKHQ